MRYAIVLLTLLACAMFAPANPPAAFRVQRVVACDCAPPALFSAPVYAPALRLEYSAPIVQRIVVPQIVQQVVVDDYVPPVFVQRFAVQRFAVERLESYHAPLAFRSFAVQSFHQPLAFSSGYSSLRLNVGHGGGLLSNIRARFSSGGLFGGGGVRASVRVGGFGY